MKEPDWIRKGTACILIFCVGFGVGCVMGWLIAHKQLWEYHVQKDRNEIRVRIQEVNKQQIQIQELLSVLDRAKEQYERLTIILEAE